MAAEENMMIGCGCLGQAESLYLKTWDYTRNRTQGGVSLFHKFQVIRHKLLKMRLEIDSLRAFIYATATEGDTGGSILALGQMCKLKGVEVLEYVGKEAVQLHGGNGVVSDNGIDAGFRDARVSSIAGGPVEAIYDMVLAFIENGAEPVL
jgi:acyl-CoA dehydrogenase